MFVQSNSLQGCVMLTLLVSRSSYPDNRLKLHTHYVTGTSMCYPHNSI